MIPERHLLAVSVLAHRTPAVAEEIHRLEQDSYAVERDLITSPDFPPLRVTAEDIRREAETFLGCWQDKTLVGVLSFSTRAGHVDIGRLVVDPRRFRQGIASRLLQAVAREARPGTRLTVSTAERNLPAIALYRKHGFGLTERTVLPDGLVLVRFHKDLPAAPGAP